MSIEWADDFGSYGFGAGSANRMLDGLYAHSNGDIVADPDPTGSGLPCWMRGGSDFQPLRRVFATTGTAKGCAQRIYVTNLPDANNQRWGLGMHKADNTPVARVVCETTGALSICTYDVDGNETVRQTTDGPAITAHAWDHLEWLVDTATHIEVRINGVSVLYWPETNDWGDNRPLAQTVMQSYNGGSHYDFYLRDYVAWNTGGTYAHDFLGSVSVVGLTTNSDVSFNWTVVGVAQGWRALSNNPPLDTTEYIVADNPPPAASTFGLTNLPDDVTSVRALVTVVRARKTDGGDGNLQLGLISSGDTALGTDRPITPSYTYFVDVFHTDPHTTAPWTPGAVDAANLQLNRTV